MNDPYEILQVHRKAEPEVIRAAYRALAQKYHPDFGGQVSRMVAITEAWAILGNADRRAEYDAQAVRSHTRRATDRKSAARPPAGMADRRGQERGTGSLIDFGRYAGWTIDSLVNHDPEYLEWLARTPIGRRLTVEIEAALSRRAAQAAALRPSQPGDHRRRSFTRPWATSTAGAR